MKAKKVKRIKRKLINFLVRAFVSVLIGTGAWCALFLVWGNWHDLYYLLFASTFLTMSLDFRRPKHQRRNRVQKVRSAAPRGLAGRVGVVRG